MTVSRGKVITIVIRKMWYLGLLLVFPLLTAAQNGCDLELKPTQDRNVDKYFKIFKWTQPTTNLIQPQANNNQDVRFECKNGFLQHELESKQYNLNCNNGKFNRTYFYKDLLCRSDFHKSEVIEKVSPLDLGSKILKCDDRNWALYEVKLEDKHGNEKHLYSSCVDLKTMRPKFSFKPKQNTPPKFTHHSRDDDVWGYDAFGANTNERYALSTGYVKNVQQKRVTKSFPEKYSGGKEFPHYYNRGHLTPYADFSELNEQAATCQYINAAPQWDVLNKNSWSLVEREVRDALKNNTSQWEVYTGTYGSIPTTRGPLNVAPIFDNTGKFIKGLLPVPKLFWKILYNTNNVGLSRAFVGVNNPDIRRPFDVKGDYRICEPITDTQGNKIQGSEFFGFTYECKYADFMKSLRVENIVK